MSILIKGMDMPENCYKCPFAMEYYSTLYMSKAGKFRKDYCCVITHKALTSTKRSRFCPLVEVSTPHGRLIDADRLFKWIKAECNPYGAPTIGYEDGLKVLDMIDRCSTIIEAEEGEG